MISVKKRKIPRLPSTWGVSVPVQFWSSAEGSGGIRGDKGYQRGPDTWDAVQACLPESISGLSDRGLVLGRAINNDRSELEAQHLAARSEAVREAAPRCEEHRPRRHTPELALPRHAGPLACHPFSWIHVWKIGRDFFVFVLCLEAKEGEIRNSTVTCCELLWEGFPREPTALCRPCQVPDLNKSRIKWTFLRCWVGGGPPK